MNDVSTIPVWPTVFMGIVTSLRHSDSIAQANLLSDLLPESSQNFSSKALRSIKLSPLFFQLGHDQFYSKLQFSCCVRVMKPCEISSSLCRQSVLVRTTAPCCSMGQSYPADSLLKQTTNQFVDSKSSWLLPSCREMRLPDDLQKFSRSAGQAASNFC